MKKFKYLTRRSTNVILDDIELCKLGVEGWELINIIIPEYNKHNTFFIYTFKKEINE